MKNFGNNVLQPTIEDFQYFNCHEVEDIIVVDGKMLKVYQLMFQLLLSRGAENS